MSVPSSFSGRERNAVPDSAPAVTSLEKRLRDLLAQGRHAAASVLADTVAAHIRTAPTSSAPLRDSAVDILLLCGRAKLAVGELGTAATYLHEALRWTALDGRDTDARPLREHLALVHALSGHLRAARAHLAQGSTGRDGEGRDEPSEPGLLARLLVALGRLELREVESLLARCERSTTDDLRWIVRHARTRAAILEGRAADVVAVLAAELAGGGPADDPATAVGALRHADLAGAYQALGDLRAAEHLLANPRLRDRSVPVLLCSARQALLRGRPDSALAALRHDDPRHPELSSVRMTPARAVMYASAEFAASGTVSDCALHYARSAVAHHTAFDALCEATPEVREALLPLLGRETAEVPQPWTYRPPVRLTRREREVLRLLASSATSAEIAVALHLSDNTVKTHLRTLYTKLGAHTREEAVWLGAADLTRER